MVVHCLRPATGILVQFNITQQSPPKRCSRNGDVLILENTAKAVIGNSLNIFKYFRKPHIPIEIVYKRVGCVLGIESNEHRIPSSKSLVRQCLIF